MAWEKWTYKIMNATVASEYNALSDANKAAYDLIISCGIISLDVDSDVLLKLFNLFPDGTDTYDNLVLLMEPEHVAEDQNG